MNKKSILFSFFILGFSIMISIYLSDKLIKNSAKGKLFSNLNTIPFRKTGILLGTTKFLKGGFINPYYKFRLEATEQLFHYKKIKYLVISGDNGNINYNEPEMMRRDLINKGIDSTLIYLDYAGFRTYDSIKRLKIVFEQDSTTIISQKFHNERALFIAEKEGISAIAFNAKDVNFQLGLKVQIREKFARVKVFLDYLFGYKAKFLGKKIKIPGIKSHPIASSAANFTIAKSFTPLKPLKPQLIFVSASN